MSKNSKSTDLESEKAVRIELAETQQQLEQLQRKYTHLLGLISKSFAHLSNSDQLIDYASESFRIKRDIEQFLVNEKSATATAAGK